MSHDPTGHEYDTYCKDCGSIEYCQCRADKYVGPMNADLGFPGPTFQTLEEAFEYLKKSKGL